MKRYLPNGQECLNVQQIAIIRALSIRWLGTTELSKRLFLQHSTIAYHINEIKRKTGLDPYCYADMTKLLQLLKESYPYC